MKKLSPRQLRRMQARMLSNLGLDLKELGAAEEAVLRFHDKEIVVKNPNVVAMRVEGETIYQIIGGEVEEREPGEEIEEAYKPSREDILLVASQAGVSEEDAERALIETEGDLAKAILLLKSRR